MVTELVVVMLATFLPGDQSSKPGPALPATATSRAGWLVGCWHSTGGDGASYTRESWTRASADVLVGTSTRIAAPFVPEYSFYRIESTPHGALSLVVQAAGERPERFLAAGAPAVSEVVFESQTATPSRRVAYRRGKKDDELVMRFETEGARPLEIPMKKGGCS